MQKLETVIFREVHYYEAIVFVDTLKLKIKRTLVPDGPDEIKWEFEVTIFNIKDEELVWIRNLSEEKMEAILLMDRDQLIDNYIPFLA